MSRVLVVTEASRTVGEIRRRWARPAWRAYLAGARRATAAAVRRLPTDAEITILAGRGFADEATLAGRVKLRFYDEESYHAHADRLARLTHESIASWWPPRDAEPGLAHHGVWLPDLLTVSSAILVRLDVMEYLGVIDRVLDDVAPDRVVLVTGASIAERLAALRARERGIPVASATRFLPSFGAAAVARGLRARQQRLYLAAHLRHRPAPPPETGARPVLLSMSHGRHLQLLAPLALALRARGQGATVLLGTGDPGAEVMRRRLGADGIPAAYFMDHLSRSDVRAIVSGARRTSRRLLARLDDHRATLAPVLAPFARDAVRWPLAVAALYLEAAVRILDATRPRAVVITSDRRFPERALALAARARGIPSILFWAGALLGRDRINLFDVGDRVAVIGEHARAALADQGVAPDRVAVLGDPRSNAARLVPAERLREEVVRDLNLVPGRPLLVLVSKYVSVLFSAEEKEALYRTVHEAARRAGDPNVVVKVHPNENLALLRQQARTWGWPDAILTQDYDIHRLFGAADAAVMVTSMAGIEAMAMGCPVVAVQTAGKDFEGASMPPYVSERAVERVDMGDAAGLASVLRTLLENAGARAELAARGRSFAARYIQPVDGALADRLLALVDEIAATGGRR